MKIIFWVIVLVVIGMVINFLDTPAIRGVSKIFIGWGTIFLAIIGVFSLMRKR